MVIVRAGLDLGALLRVRPDDVARRLVGAHLQVSTSKPASASLVSASLTVLPTIAGTSTLLERRREDQVDRVALGGAGARARGSGG